eukprot:1920158-Rhodomonas_salina.1
MEGAWYHAPVPVQVRTAYESVSTRQRRPVPVQVRQNRVLARQHRAVPIGTSAPITNTPSTIRLTQYA